MDTADTIAALATPPGQGAVGIVRVSGPGAPGIARALLGRLPAPRQALFRRFRAPDGSTIDEGIALFFPGPHSFTGEHILELQGHGGPVVLDLLLQRVLSLGARPARPGEFSERAFLNGKIDLAEAEAIADLIASETDAAARLAVRSLQGEFSCRIHALVESLIDLRLFVEASMDFPEEEIDFLSDRRVVADLRRIIAQAQRLKEGARVGRLISEGMLLVIAGPPNAGKSSLMNALAGRETAIVTDLPGTTRDLLRERIQIDGMPLHLVDTAGLRETSDRVEQEGVRRAQAEIAKADLILWVFDDSDQSGLSGIDTANLPADVPCTLVRNKIDLTGRAPAILQTPCGTELCLSATGGTGLPLLFRHLKQRMNYQGPEQGEFIARRRHLAAIDRAVSCLHRGAQVLERAHSGELLAEELRLAQQNLGEVTGEFTTDDLLGRIFSSFCIGK